MTARRRLQSLRRAATTTISLTLINLASAPPALADAGTLALASWINVTDSHGVSVGSYGLSLDNGSLTNPTAGATALITHWLYGIFQTIIGLALWLVDNVLGFQWLDALARPLNDLGPKLTGIALHPYLVVAVGTIAAIIIALNMVRGHVSKAGAQAGTAAVLVLLAVTFANKPLAELIGSGGLLAQGRDIGVQLATALSPDSQSLSGRDMVHRLSANLADHFARTPTMVWNFGADLDGPGYRCGDLWSAAITAGPLDTVKDAVRACPQGQRLHDYAIEGASQQMTTGFMAVVFALAVLVVFGYLCYHVVILALSALFWAIVAVFAAVAGLIPGPAQTLAVKAALDAIFSWIGMAIYVAVVGVVGALSAALFNATDNSMVSMPLVTMLLIAVFFALRRVRGGLTSLRDNAATKTGALGRNAGPAAGPLAPAADASPGQLDRIDPLSSVPVLTGKAGHQARRGGKAALSAAGKLGRLIVAPEAAAASTAASAAGKAAAKVAAPKKPAGTTPSAPTTSTPTRSTGSSPATAAAGAQPASAPTTPTTAGRPLAPRPAAGGGTGQPAALPAAAAAAPTRPPGRPPSPASVSPAPSRPSRTITATTSTSATSPGSDPAPTAPLRLANPGAGHPPAVPHNPPRTAQQNAPRGPAVHPALLEACTPDPDTPAPTSRPEAPLRDRRRP